MSKAVCAVLALVLLPAAAAGQGRRGPQVQVNEGTGSYFDPVAALAEDGTFVVVWSAWDGDSLGVFARRFSEHGAPLTDEFLVNTSTFDPQHQAQVASEPDGDFVVVWRSPDGNGDGIFGRRFYADGTPIAGEFQVNSYTTGIQAYAALSADADGSFVVLWSGERAGDLAGVSGRRFDGSATPMAADFAVNGFTTAGQQRPAVLMTGGGAFVAAWDSSASGGLDVYARRYDASGAPLASEFRVNTYTSGQQLLPALARRRSGAFVVTWSSAGQDGSGYGVFGRTFPSAGAGGVEFLVNTYTTGDQESSKVAGDGAGNFTVVWHGQGPGDDDGAFGRHYLPPGAPIGPEFAVNLQTSPSDTHPSITMAGDGSSVVVWESGAPGSSAATLVLGQRFTPEIVFADDFDSGTFADWSANATSGGDLTVAGGAAALGGSTRGLSVLVDDTSGRWVQDDTPDDEARYRARFYFDPNGFDPGEALDHRRLRLFVAFEENPTRRLAAVVLRRLNGAYALAGRARLDDDSQHDTGFFPITDDEHFVEIDWRRASKPAANDGAFEMWIDGTSVYATTSLDNDVSGVDFARLGALSAKDGVAGTLYLDEFESRRSSYIGP
jgi:hypothetical protein